jgi:hypothetical protein
MGWGHILERRNIPRPDGADERVEKTVGALGRHVRHDDPPTLLEIRFSRNRAS